MSLNARDHTGLYFTCNHGSWQLWCMFLHSPVVTRGETRAWCVCMYSAWPAGPGPVQVIPCSGAYLASADSHEEATLAPPDGGVVVRHDCVKGLTSALGLGDHLLQGCQLAP